MDNYQREKEILERLVKSREAIKQKYRQLQQNKTDFDRALSETFKPIINPLEELVTEAKKPKKQKGPEQKAIEQKAIEQKTTEQPTARKSDEDSDVNETLINPDTSFDTAESEQEEEEGEDKYLLMLQSGSKQSLDNVFGVREEDDVMKIGNAPINFTNQHVIVHNTKYPKTIGLLELLFKKQPDSLQISSSDIQNYRKIVEVTNAFRRDYREDQPVRKSTSNKYKNYIAPFFDKTLKRKGAGLLPRYKIARKGQLADYVYWDDPNELVDRLRLLMAEFSARNKSHVNEIHSIIEELREADYVY